MISNKDVGTENCKKAIGIGNYTAIIDPKTGIKLRIKVKEPKINAKRIGYIVTTTVTSSLRKEDQHRDIRYWTYHHDKERYGIVLVSSKVVEELDF